MACQHPREVADGLSVHSCTVPVGVRVIAQTCRFRVGKVKAIWCTRAILATGGAQRQPTPACFPLRLALNESVTTGEGMAMALYLLEEVACCVLVAVALVLFIGGSVLAGKAGVRLAGGIWQTGARLAQGHRSEVAFPGDRHAILAFPSSLKSARAFTVELGLHSKTK